MTLSKYQGSRLSPYQLPTNHTLTVAGKNTHRTPKSFGKTGQTVNWATGQPCIR
jgi:hypothetical protein